MWTLHKDCLNLVSQTWHSKVYGCPVYVLDKNLRILKANLKEWNKNSFGNVQEKVKLVQNGDRKFGCDEKTIKAVCVQNVGCISIGNLLLFVVVLLLSTYA